MNPALRKRGFLVIIKVINLHLQSPDHQNVGGGYDSSKRGIILAPVETEYRPLMELEAKFDKPWKAALAHEMGHALLDQWRDSNSWLSFRDKYSPYGWNRAAHEAFANLAMVVQGGHADPQPIREAFSDCLDEETLLFSPSRIALYRLEQDKFEDPAILHYLCLKFSPNILRKVVLAPRGFIAGSWLDPLVETRLVLSAYESPSEWVGDKWFKEFDSWMIKTIGMTSKDISNEAYRWYQQGDNLN